MIRYSSASSDVKWQICLSQARVIAFRLQMSCSTLNVSTLFPNPTTYESRCTTLEYGYNDKLVLSLSGVYHPHPNMLMVKALCSTSECDIALIYDKCSGNDFLLIQSASPQWAVTFIFLTYFHFLHCCWRVKCVSNMVKLSVTVCHTGCLCAGEYKLH